MTTPSPSHSVPLGRLIGMIAVFVVVGVPIVAFLWETLNHALALEATPMQLLLAAGALVVFVGLLAVLMRLVNRMTSNSQR